MVTPVVTSLDITDTGISAVHNIEAVRVEGIHRLQLILGEWLLDAFEGVPYELIFSGLLTVPQVTALITEELKKIRHITAVNVTLVDLNRKSRRYRYSATIQTDFGGTTTIEVNT